MGIETFRFDIDSKYEPLKVLGAGSYGVVIAANDTDSQKRVAIKKITDWSEDWDDGLRIVREIKLLTHFAKYPHPNIISLANVMASPLKESFDEVYIVMDKMDTDMHKIIYSKNKLENKHCQRWIHATLRALRFMHSGNIIHRDLKPSNLLLNKDCSLKICDFGLSRGIGPEIDKDLTEYVVTRWYRAPELMCGCDYGPKIDIWSLGVIFAELLGRKPLMKGRDYKDQLRLIIDVLGTPCAEDIANISNKSARSYIQKMPMKMGMPFRQRFPRANKYAIDLLGKMLQFNPDKRITAEDALNHPWIRHLNSSRSYGEDICPEPINFNFEGKDKLIQNDRLQLQQLMWDLIRETHPELPEKRQLGKKIRKKKAK